MASRLSSSSCYLLDHHHDSLSNDPSSSTPSALSSTQQSLSAVRGHHEDHGGATTTASSHYSPSDYTTSGTASARSSSPAKTPAVATAAATRARKKASLAAINAPSFSAFRSNLPSNHAVRQHAAFQQQKSPRAASFSISEKASPRLADPHWRPYSLESPLPTPGLQTAAVSSLPHRQGSEVIEAPLRDNEVTQAREEVDRSSYTIPIGYASHDRNASIDSHIASTVPSSAYSSRWDSSTPVHAKHAHDKTAPFHAHRHSVASTDSNEQQFSDIGGSRRASMLSVRNAPTMTLQLDGVQRRLTDEELEEYSQASYTSQPKRPKSPTTNGGISRFFGWNGTRETEGTSSSPTTTFSERSLSPLPSPIAKTLPIEMANSRLSARLTPPGLDVQKANATYFDNPDTPLLLGDSVSNAHVRELERELRHISEELANSIRREMELEDELDHVRGELPMIAQSELGARRSSDYFSDSGASSTKFPITDVDARLEHLDKKVRKVEQEKANLKLEMASKLQTELNRRRDLEELVRDLEDQVEKKEGQQDIAVKLNELESTLDETKRRLGQEKMTKENFEDLYSATREELERFRNEAENLRNEVVPQLKSRLEGLEAEAADSQAVMYENTRLQQVVAQLKGESGHSRFNSIAEEGVANAGRMSLHRSGSLARSSSLRRGGSIKQDRSDGGRQRSGSNGAYPDGDKDMVDQRDALHKALKLLIKRYESQQKEHERAMKKLTSAKDKAESITPKRTVYAREVAFLKAEVSTLRKRTEDALEQKWQYEKNLGGLKMDLDRAEQETRGLRIMLSDRDDVSAPSQSSQYGGDEEDAQLKLSISRAESERDHAKQVANEYRQRAKEADPATAKELISSADRMDELADELETQVQANSRLRERLSAAIAKGEREQKQSTKQIEDMQKRLAGMEDSVLAAQQHSETTLANHDAEVKRIDDAHSPSLQRLRISIPEASKLAPSSPLLRKSPKLGSKKLIETSLLEMSRTQLLERKVRELEGLLREAEEDMQHVVERVNHSQMEVADLQTERDAALVQMRKLQGQIVQERERAEAFIPVGKQA
ncbi:hypothetical protein Slin15195_G007970 [Septoria linicola]|uniref:DUF7603 domain-containing protein n=1 Tax=Septoria linicola TaxID=215465 RepID=A0A9Q9EFQ0_9PEZI|nr:hypothetical protein Slin14017_G007980 [Septoria linicola]USW47478.1 hypothetical protein Slin15195_G007970 [Septoria linicola]